MIDISATPAAATVPGPIAGQSGAARGDAPDFADLVARQGAGRTVQARDGEREAPTPTGETGETDGASDASAPNQDDAATADDAPSWPARGLHKVLSILFGDGSAPPPSEPDPVPATEGEPMAELAVASPATPLKAVGDEAETDTELVPDEDDVDDETVDTGDTGAVAAAIILPVEMREQRPSGAGTARQAEQSANASSAPPTAKANDETAQQDDGARSGGEDRRREAPADAAKARVPAPEGGDMKVRVVAESVVPPPGPSQIQRTIADLAASMAGESDWTSAMERATSARAETTSTPAGPVRDLRIQLNPAELGTVEARLRIVGEQLSVEIRVEGGEAFRRLSSERDAILSALRGLGFAVDDVLIQQQSPISGQAQTNQNNAGGRQNDTQGGASQGTGRDQNGEGGAAGGRQRDNEQGGRNGDARTPVARPAGGGLYI